jgi:glycosyltransferase involved in cell wall biosynthesis
MSRSGINPFRELGLTGRLARIYGRQRPDIVHHFTIKCVLHGSLAAQISGIPRRINAVTGLGYVFSSSSLRARLLRPLVRQLLRLALRGRQSRLIMQNADDVRSFDNNRSIESNRVCLIRGSGVNTDRFRPRVERAVNHRFRVLLASRLIREKGIEEYVDSAQQLRAEGLDVEFVLAGSSDPGNPSAIPVDLIRSWTDDGLVTAAGHVDDMLQWLHQVDAVVLPSYYGEGVPRSLIEAAACGLPVVTTDAPGCREAVEHRTTGLLIPCRNSEALADAIRYLYENPAECARMGAAGRQRVLREFDESIVLTKTLDVYRELLSDWHAPGRSQQLC